MAPSKASSLASIWADHLGIPTKPPPVTAFIQTHKVISIWASWRTASQRWPLYNLSLASIVTIHRSNSKLRRARIRSRHRSWPGQATFPMDKEASSLTWIWKIYWLITRVPRINRAKTVEEFTQQPAQPSSSSKWINQRGQASTSDTGLVSTRVTLLLCSLLTSEPMALTILLSRASTGTPSQRNLGKARNTITTLSNTWWI